MSLLLNIIEEAKSKPHGIEEDWLALRNAYFRGETPYQDIESWAEENNLVATFIDGGPRHANPPRVVHFRVKS